MTVAEAVALPAAPVHTSVYVSVPIAVGVSVVEPLVASVPDHAPDAIQDFVFVELHESVTGLPTAMVEGDAVSLTVGAAGLTVTVAEPQIAVYPVCVEQAVMVAVVVAVIEAEGVNTPVALIVPFVAVQLTAEL